MVVTGILSCPYFNSNTSSDIGFGTNIKHPHVKEVYIYFCMLLPSMITEFGKVLSISMGIMAFIFILKRLNK